MILWISTIGLIYIGALGYCAYRGRSLNKGSESDYITAGSSLGPTLGFLTFSATLFSTFTLMGMPDFFRNHGVGAWIFLGVTDVAMAFVALWFGLHFRAHVRRNGFESVSKLLNQSYKSSLPSWVYLIGIFIFLVPYVSIQIRGISVFLETVVPFDIPMAVWSIAILFSIFIYSGIGGLRAIVYSDAVQGVVLLIVTWVIAATCYNLLGGNLSSVFSNVEKVDSTLLSTPGPKGLFTTQFLLASFLVIVVMPISQPQLTMRIAILRSDSNLKLMAIAIGIFSLLVIMPAIVIGAYGSVFFSGRPATEFWEAVIVTNQAPVLASLAIVGLIAAAMSTADSQLFALGTEYGSVLKKNTPKRRNLNVKIILVLFSLCALGLSILSTNDLVLLARVSFAGTALLAPMIIVAIAKNANYGITIPAVTLSALVTFLLSLFGVLPKSVMDLRMDLILLITVSVISFSVYVSSKIKRGN